MTARPHPLGYAPGSRLDSLSALKLAALPVSGWAIVPGPSGRGLTLMRCEQMTAAQREAASTWAEKNRRRIAKHAPPRLTAVYLDADALTLEALDAQGEALSLTIGRPYRLSREGEALTVWAGTGTAAQLLAVYALTPEGAASLDALTTTTTTSAAPALAPALEV